MILGSMNFLSFESLKNNRFTIPFAKKRHFLFRPGTEMIQRAIFGRKQKRIRIKCGLPAIQTDQATIQVQVGKMGLYLWFVAGAAGNIYLFFLVRMNRSIAHYAFFRVAVDTVHSGGMMQIRWQLQIKPTT